MRLIISSYVLVISVSSLLTAVALEPLKDSSKDFIGNQVNRLVSKGDKNKDETLQKSEDAKTWKKYSKFDLDKSSSLTKEELTKAFNAQQIDSPGEKLLNVLYKKTARGGLYLDFYFPDQDTNKEKPVVVFTHGGGWSAGNKVKAGQGDFKKVHKALLSKGYCVMSVGYRLVNKTKDTAMRDCVIDCKDAVRFLSAHKEELGIDPNKIYLFGDSAGGHLAQMLLFSPPNSFVGDPELAKFSFKPVAGVSWYGPCDFQDIQLFNHDDSENFNDRFGPRIMGGGLDPADKEMLYKEMSPVSYLSKDSAPLLMIQGDKDTTIPVKQAYRMQEAIKTIPAPVDFIFVKNAGHNWRSVDAPIEPTVGKIVEETVQFLLEH